MRYTIRKSELDDVKKLAPYMTESGKTDSFTLATTDEAKTFLCDDKPLMILGLEYLPSAGEEIQVGMWGMFSRDVSKHVKPLVRACKDLLFDRVGFCFFVLIDEQNPVFVRFATFFGFQRTEIVERIEQKLYHMYMKRT